MISTSTDRVPVIYGPGPGDADDKIASPLGHATSSLGALRVAVNRLGRHPSTLRAERWTATLGRSLSGQLAWFIGVSLDTPAPRL